MGNDPEYTTVRLKRTTARALKFDREREPYESIIASLLELKRPSLESGRANRSIAWLILKRWLERGFEGRWP